MKQILKRTGILESWNIRKIEEVIERALYSVDSGNYVKLSQELANEVGAKFKWKRIVPQEAVQDAVENILMEQGHKQAAKNFILYREKRRIAREIGQSQIDIMDTITDYIGRGDWRIRENSNIQFSFQGLILYLAESTQSRYCLNLYPESIRNAHSQGFIHIHDLGFGLAGYCAGWSLGDLLREGINNVGYCSSAPARNFTTAINHIVNFMGTLQNEWAGAMAFNSIDTYLAPFIRYEGLTYRQVYQNIQSLIFNLNTTSRWGGQCCDETTECLSLNGWKKYDELKEGELIYTYDLESKSLKLKPIKKINIYDYDGDMIHMLGRKVDFLVTPNHKVVRELFNSGEKMVLQEAEGLMSLKTPFNIPLGGNFERDTEFPLSDDEIRLLAWCLSDSHMEKDKDRIRFYQSIIKYHERIRKILDTLGIKYSVQERYSKFSKNVIYQFSVYGDVVRKFKELTNRNRNAIPEEFKKQASIRQLRIFINELCYTDGIDKGFKFHKIDDNNPDLRDHDCVIIGRRSEEFIKDLQEIIILAGYSTGVQWERDSESSHRVVLYQQDKGGISKKEYTHYKGKVWCPTTEVGTFVARRDGKVFITGNSPFTNVTLDVVCPKYMRNQSVIIGGKLQKETYGEFQKEMDIFNNAFLDVFMKGDRDGRIFSFPIPTYNITKEFPWNSKFGDKLAEMTGKYGVPYFQNFINSDLNPEDVRSMCCRLSLDKREIIKHTGGIFGSADLTGSIGVCTLNLARLGYLAKDKEEFFELVKYYAEVAKNSLEIKRKTLEYNLEHNMFPWTKRYLKRGFKGHFSTIGLVAGHEACLNLIGKGINTEEGKSLMIETLNLLKDLTVKFQEETGNLYNLEATPAEGCTYRLAKLDKQHCPDIIQSGKDVPFYTNSTQLPVDSSMDIIDAVMHQSDLQKIYTGGVVFHTFLGESVMDKEVIKKYITRVFSNTRLPYLSITPTFSICPDHGYIRGEYRTCPECGSEVECFSRIVGYYRKITSWNISKQEEFKERKVFKLNE